MSADRDKSFSFNGPSKKVYIKKVVSAGALFLAVVGLLFGCSADATSSSSSSMPASSTAEDSVSPMAPAAAAPHDINFAELLNQNSDVIAWIRVPNTAIDDPVMRGIDNEYYLRRDIEKEYYVGGSIFIDMINSNDFTDPVTVAYGHYMPDDTLFTDLHKFRDESFFNENRDVFIYLFDKTLQYEVVAAFNIGQENVLYNKDYTQPDVMQAFVDWASAPRDLEANVRMDEASADDRFLVLSTCQAVDDSSSRYIVLCRLVAE